MNTSLKLSALAIAIASATSAFAAEPASSLEQALTDGDATLNLRYRFEFVDQEGLKEAKASTLKTRLTYETLAYQNASAVLEFDNVTEVLSDDYNSTQNGQTKYAVVADPEYTSINQAYLNYAAPAETTVRLGRQLIILDNQRFVGGVGWRQNEQTYDALTLINKALPQTTITASYVAHVKNIFDKDVDAEHTLLNISNTSLPAGTISAYAYLLKDISDTYGLRFDGKSPMNDITLLYTAEYAMQNADNAADNDADYLLGELGADIKGITAKLGYELQTSDSGAYAFRTPLGTNHAFNGWADKFLTTPANGLEDLYVTLSTKLAGPNIAVTYHQFDADEGGANYGDEIDFVVGQKFGKNYDATLKLAQYNAEDFSKDTTKVWLMLGAKF